MYDYSFINTKKTTNMSKKAVTKLKQKRQKLKCKFS